MKSYKSEKLMDTINKITKLINENPEYFINGINEVFRETAKIINENPKHYLDDITETIEEST